jgi:hypothetical protein
MMAKNYGLVEVKTSAASVFPSIRAAAEPVIDAGSANNLSTDERPLHAPAALRDRCLQKHTERKWESIEKEPAGRNRNGLIEVQRGAACTSASRIFCSSPIHTGR